MWEGRKIERKKEREEERKIDRKKERWERGRERIGWLYVHLLYFKYLHSYDDQSNTWYGIEKWLKKKKIMEGKRNKRKREKIINRKTYT